MSPTEVFDRPPRPRWGKAGVEVGEIAYGCWRFADTPVAIARSKIEAAVELGMTLIDTADIYGIDTAGFGSAEELLGEVFAEAPELRDRVVLATKGGIRPPTPYNSSPEYLRDALEDSLRRLQVDHIDLFQIHRPDLLVSPASVAQSLAEMVESGKVTHVGVSNYTVSQLAALQTHLDIPLVTNQPEMSLLRPDPIFDGTLDQCMQFGMTPLAWSPLGGGRLLHPSTVEEHRVAEVAQACAERHETSTTAIALAFLLAHPAGVLPIIGTQQPARMAEAMEATEIRLGKAEWYELYEAATGVPLP